MWQVIGQPLAVEFLQRSIQAERTAKAYLFVGPPQVGKRTLAVNFAQALCCVGGSDDKPCGRCSNCRRIAAGNYPDFQVMDLLVEGKGKDSRRRKEIGIDQVRDLQHTIVLQPYEGRHRVFVIQGAENLSTEAANALLKTLEEPPSHAVLILLTINDTLLLPTVLSRCQRVDFRPVPESVLELALIDKWGIPVDQARFLSKLSHGRVGWAVSAATDPTTLDKRSSVLGKVAEIMSGSRIARLDFAAQMAGQFTRDRQSVREELDLWLSWWRDLMLARCGCSELVVNTDRTDEILRLASLYSLQKIKDVIDFLQTTMEQLEQNANPRLALEVLMLRLPYG